MASFTHVAQDISPQYGRVTKITNRLGRSYIRNSMDGGRINAGVYTLYRNNYKKAG